MKIKFLILFLFIFINLFASDLYYYQNGVKKYLKKKVVFLKNQKKSKYIDYYYNENNILLGINDKILIKIKNNNNNNNNNNNIVDILNRYNLELIKKFKHNTYLVKTKNKGLTLKLSNELYNENYVIYANPDFIKQKFKR